MMPRGLDVDTAPLFSLCRFMGAMETFWRHTVLIDFALLDLLNDFSLQPFDVYIRYCTNQIYQERTLRKLKCVFLCRAEYRANLWRHFGVDVLVVFLVVIVVVIMIPKINPKLLTCFWWPFRSKTFLFLIKNVEYSVEVGNFHTAVSLLAGRRTQLSGT